MKIVRLIDLQKKKEAREPIVMLTCYDATFARLIDMAGVDILLVGDSLGMVIQGASNTLSVSMDDMVYHTRAVARGCQRAHLVADMPFMTYQTDLKVALENAANLLRAGAHSVKVEGGRSVASTVRAMTEAGIPVMGHVGLTPQSVHALSGHRIQGRTEEASARILEDSLALQEAGVYAIVLECVPETLAQEISTRLVIPTIGIGAGRFTDGQVLVSYDLLGLNPEFKPRFLKTYLNGASLVMAAVEKYVTEVRHGEFPAQEHVSVI
ncbi:MAG: 3-methyl-2-oxobutanoate hydroxymethyltransferase [Myxococcota bacterium]